MSTSTNQGAREVYGTISVDTAPTITVAEPISVDDNAGSLTVDNAALSVVGGGLEATALRVTLASDSTGVLSIDDNAGSLTVDGTLGATQSGTWTVQPGNTANTTAWKVDGSAVTQPVSGTFWQATQPVSGTVTAAAQPGVDIGDVTLNNATLAVTQSGTWDEVGINDSGNSITVDNAALSVTGDGPVTSAQRVVIADMNAGEYETVAASQTAQVLGATGATGDWISGILVVPATTSPGNVLLLDNATSITVFTGGATSVSNLVPFFIPLGMKSVSGAWKVTTGANVSCIGIGNFTA